MSQPSEEECTAELRDAGMTEESIKGLAELTERFKVGFAAAKDSAEGPDKFIEEYTADAKRFREAMPAGDQEIYSVYLKKHGLDG
ncbi:hypothetical protein L5515_009013 [Caenorhabditis briggsae]|uniref:Uncharacterized protein n=1 Tax=Caenorhabditis briggsae TaxID=6238 RepID=A0AAE9F2Z7_CAEBR|nr:hypothetical protein L5515_009013 [Caenorhabditis briggsae]